MTESIKIFHFTDVHIGTYIGKAMPVPNAALSLHQSVFDVLKALDTLTEKARIEQPDAILCAGDWFDRVVNSRVVLTAVTKRVNALTEIAPVVIVNDKVFGKQSGDKMVKNLKPYKEEIPN